MNSLKAATIYRILQKCISTVKSSHAIYLWVTTCSKTVSYFAFHKTHQSNERAKQFSFLLDSQV